MINKTRIVEPFERGTINQDNSPIDGETKGGTELFSFERLFACCEQAGGFVFRPLLARNGRDIKGPSSRMTLLRRDVNSIVIIAQWSSKDDSFLLLEVLVLCGSIFH